MSRLFVSGVAAVAWLAVMSPAVASGVTYDKLAYLTFNGDNITKSTEPNHAETAKAFVADGAAWLEHPGNYKSAAFISHERIREYAEGIFEVEKVVERDYDTMDALYARPL